MGLGWRGGVRPWCSPLDPPMSRELLITKQKSFISSDRCRISQTTYYSADFPEKCMKMRKKPIGRVMLEEFPADFCVLFWLEFAFAFEVAFEPM